MKSIHPKYQELIKNIPEIKRYFDVKFLTLPNEKSKLVRFSRNDFIDNPLLILMAGCHGEEPAPSLAIFKDYKLISKAAKNISISN